MHPRSRAGAPAEFALRRLVAGRAAARLAAVNFALSLLVTVLMAVLFSMGIVQLATGSVWLLLLVTAAFFFVFIRYGCLRH